MNKKILIIGLDGATWDLIKPWTQEGKLPTFKKMMENGAWGELESTIPPVSFPAWPSFLTAKNPGKIGASYFLQREKNSYELKITRLNWRKLNPLWKILSKWGKRTYIIGIPGINIDEEINGKFIPGPLGIPDPTRPAPTIQGFKEDEFLKNLYKYTQEQLTASLKLLEENNWDLFMFVVYPTDSIQHIFWKYVDKNHPMYKLTKYENAIQEYFQFIDSWLSKFLDRMPKGTIVFVVSDHGNGPLYKRVSLNKWLEINGYLKLSKRKGIKEIKRKVVNLLWRLRIFRIGSSVLKLLGFKNLGLFSRNLLKPLSPGSRVTQSIDWRKTKAYSFSYAGISINLKDREPLGQVRHGEYERLRKQIMKKLKDLRDPENGLNIIDKIWGREEVYWGPYTDSLPDIIIEFTDDSKYEASVVYLFTEHFLRGEIFYLPQNPPNSSSHTRRGIFLAYGLDIKQNTKIEGAKIYDVVPTILHIYDVPLPKDIDGKVLKKIFKEDSELAKRPVKYQEIDEKERIKEKIECLKASGKI